jgi:hypothetical protein
VIVQGVAQDERSLRGAMQDMRSDVCRACSARSAVWRRVLQLQEEGPKNGQSEGNGQQGDNRGESL